MRMFDMRRVPCEMVLLIFRLANTFPPSFSGAKFSVERVGLSEKRELRKEPYVSLQYTYTKGKFIAFSQYKHFRRLAKYNEALFV